MIEQHVFPQELAVGVYHDGRPAIVLGTPALTIYIVIPRADAAKVGAALQQAGTGIVVPPTDGKGPAG